MNRWKQIAVAVGMILFAYLTAPAQETCPENLVCISKEAAIKAVETSELAKAQAVQITELKQAITDKDKLIGDIKIQLASVMGENSALKQNAVSDRAIIEILLKNTRKKCLPLTICL